MDAWQPQCRVAVNLSPAQFRDRDLPDLLADILYRTALPAGMLELEVTEGVLIRDEEQALTTLRALKAQGVLIALDDFGTGYSSLSYLKMLPLDVLKIDRSFVRGIGQNAEDDAIVQEIISLAKSLGLAVTAEGIETTQQAELLLSVYLADAERQLLRAFDDVPT